MVCKVVLFGRRRRLDFFVFLCSEKKKNENGKKKGRRKQGTHCVVYKCTAVQANVLADSYRLVYDTPLNASSKRLCHFSMRF